MKSRRRAVQGAVVLIVLLLCFGAVYWQLWRGRTQSTSGPLPPPGTGAPATGAAPAAAAPAETPPADSAVASETTPGASRPGDAQTGLAQPGEGALASPLAAGGVVPGAGRVPTADTAALAAETAPSPAPSAPATSPPAEPSAAPTATAVATEETADAGADAGESPAPPSRRTALAPPVDTSPPGVAVGRFHDAVGWSYRLLGVKCWLDGALIYQGRGSDLGLFHRKLSAGEHSISVEAQYEGHGGPLLPYMDSYLFKVRAGRVFTVRSKEKADVTVTAFERGGATAKYEKRLTLAVAVR